MAYIFKNWKEICEEKDRRIKELEEQQEALIALMHESDERMPRMTTLEFLKSKDVT